MKVRMEIEMTPEEAQQMIVQNSDQQTKIYAALYDAYMNGLKNVFWNHVDPDGNINRNK